MKNDKERNARVLIITSSGGGGLLQAARAKEQEVKRINPNAKVVKIDMLRDWVWRKIGHFAINLWDRAQRKGKVRTLEWALRQQKYAEILFWPSVFLRMLTNLLRKDITRVIDTQPIGISPSLKAIRLYNRIRKKDVYLEKVIVDLPTVKASHFFEPVKKLSKKDLQALRLITIEPLLEKGQTADEFWLKYTGLLEKEIYYEDCFIRESFHKYMKKREKKDYELKIRTKNSEEKKLILKACKKGCIDFKDAKDHIEFKIGKNEHVFTILLGSQPAYEATLNYIKKIIGLAKKYPTKNKFHAFVFCAHHKPGEESLLKKAHEVITRTKNFPANLSVIPVSFQNEEVIAPIFHRSDLTCTRSGGQTSMELMKVMGGKIWIHSEAKVLQESHELSMEELLKGIPGWEAGNASYLMAKKGAEIITPCSFERHLIPILQNLQ